MKLVTRWTKRKEIAAERLKICEGCDRLNIENYQCQECGCFMKFKTEWPFAKCPLDKWTSYTEENTDG
jgi:hypothetical protein